VRLLLGDGASGGRVHLAMTALAVTALGHPLGITGGHLALRSRVAAFSREFDADGELREICDVVWSARGANVLQTVQQLAAGRPDALGDAWRSWAIAAWQACLEEPAPGAREPDRSTAGSGPRRLSVVDGGEDAGDQARAERVCTDVLAELLTTCGVAPVEQYLAGHLVVEATERMIGRPRRERWTTA